MADKEIYKKIGKQEASHYLWGDGCDSWVLVNENALSVKLESMPPYTKENSHYHSMAIQFFYLLKGEAVFNIQGKEITVCEKEGILIPHETIHFIKNKSKETIEFLVISEPTTNNDRILSD